MPGLVDMIYYGGDYNPEQWPESVWQEDVQLMREAGVNLVTLGVFSWSRIQPAEGVFDWEWLDRILDLLHEGGIGVCLATATASPPHWLSVDYPQSLPVTRDGVTLGPGSRQHYAPTAPDYRRFASELVRRMTERYAEHPAVQMWHINNEYGCHLHADYSINAELAFREWLREKYSTIDRLNEAWGTAFWSQIYGSFDEVLPPRTAPYSTNPTGWLDFKRFTSAAFLDLFRMEKGIIRAAGAEQPVTTNFMGAFEPIDYWSWASELDIISDDNYPDPADPESFRGSAFTRDLMRSLGGGRPWILMEQAANAVNWRPVNAPKAPGQMAALSRQAIARGATGILFFQWRQSRSGAEKFHSAMLPHGGTGTRTWREVTELGRTLAELPEERAADARVAVLLDWENWWSLGAPDHPAQLDYLANVQAWHASLHRKNVLVDLAHPGADLSEYDLVIAPQLGLMSDDTASRLAEWVESGGTLVTTAFTDVSDLDDRFLTGGFLTRLKEVVGAHVSEHEGLPTPLDVEFDGRTVVASTLAEVLEVADADVIGRFRGGWRDGRPAITHRRSGAGHSIHVGFIPDQAGLSGIVDRALETAGLAGLKQPSPEGVELIRLAAGGTLAINHSGELVAVSVGGEDAELEPFAVRAVG
ncbi:beta-galactosidase [Humibacter soli]